jgi:hypothetical protein
MNLVVASRHDGLHLRFDVEGRWRNGDALKLAYLVKAAVARMRQDHVLIDLRGVATPPGAEGQFLICDRLRRALTHKTRVVLVAAAELVDSDNVPVGLPMCADIALFGTERDAMRWLGLQEAQDIPALALGTRKPRFETDDRAVVSLGRA